MLSVNINKQILLNNYDQFTLNYTNVWPCLKCDAYGLGIQKVLKVLHDNRKISAICVDSLVDIASARELYNGDILYFGPILKQIINYSSEYNVIPTIYSVDQVEMLKDKIDKVFVEIDVGMNRYGCSYNDIEVLLSTVINSGVKIYGVLAHFSNQELEYHTSNLNHYSYIVSLKEKYKFDHISCLSSETAYTYEGFPDNVIRPGIGLYGYFSSDSVQSNFLNTVLQVSTYISNVRELNKGDSFGYGLNYLPIDYSKIAIIPVGYAHGLSKNFEKFGFVSIGGKLCNILFIAMSSAFINVTGLDVGIGDDVEIVGNNLNLFDWARRNNTLPQEILLGFCRGRQVEVDIS